MVKDMDTLDIKRAIEQILLEYANHEFMEVGETADKILALFTEPAQSERWKPRVDEQYFTVDYMGDISAITWVDDEVDNKCWDMGNCFKSHQEAEQAREK